MPTLDVINLNMDRESISQHVQEEGYNHEQYEVETEDGYLL